MLIIALSNRETNRKNVEFKIKKTMYFGKNDNLFAYWKNLYYLCRRFWYVMQSNKSKIRHIDSMK